MDDRNADFPQSALSVDPVSEAWQEKAHLIREFLDNRPLYEQIGNEVAYILRKRMDGSGIEYSAITYRAKTLDSFIEKLARKSYGQPFDEITDFAGVRLVYLYKSDRTAIENLIETEFEILERIDKIEEQDADQFGYGALHYIVRLGRKNSGARYDDLRRFLCEIQVRTILQDAWAIIDHHLIYKKEATTPKSLKRKLNSVAGLFETADDQFDLVREEHRLLFEKSNKADTDFLDQNLDADTLSEYLRRQFPTRDLDDTWSYISSILEAVDHYLGYTKLREVEALLSSTEEARKAINEESPPKYASTELAFAVALVEPQYRQHGWPEHTISLLDKYQHLVKRRQ